MVSHRFFIVNIIKSIITFIDKLKFTRVSFNSKLVIVFHRTLKVLSLRKQQTYRDATTGFPAKWRLRNERRNSILMTPHYPDLGRPFDWSCHVRNFLQPIRSTTQISVVMLHQFRISALVSQTSFSRWNQWWRVAKCWLFSQAIKVLCHKEIHFHRQRCSLLISTFNEISALEWIPL